MLVFSPHKQFCQRFGFTIWNPEEVSPGISQAGGNLSGTLTIPIRTEGIRKWESNSNFRRCLAAEESVCFEYWVTQPLLQKGAYEGGEPTNRVECGWGFWYPNINYIFANSFVLQNCWRQHPGVIKLPIFAGHQT